MDLDKILIHAQTFLIIYLELKGRCKSERSNTIKERDVAKDLVSNQDVESWVESLDRICVGSIFWLEQIVMSSCVLYWWIYRTVPYDLHIPTFLALITALFVLGYILEWKYHVAYPLAKIKPGFRLKKNMLRLIISVLLATTCVAVFWLSYDFSTNHQFSFVFGIFVGILGFSFLTLYCMAIIKKLKGLCRTSSKKNAVRKETSPNTDVPIKSV